MRHFPNQGHSITRTVVAPLLPSTTEAHEAHATEANRGFLPELETSRAMASAASISGFDEGAVLAITVGQQSSAHH